MYVYIFNWEITTLSTLEGPHYLGLIVSKNMIMNFMNIQFRSDVWKDYGFPLFYQLVFKFHNIVP
jgi:hypothetical protein